MWNTNVLMWAQAQTHTANLALEVPSKEKVVGKTCLRVCIMGVGACRLRREETQHQVLEEQAWPGRDGNSHVAGEVRASIFM